MLPVKKSNFLAATLKRAREETEKERKCGERKRERERDTGRDREREREGVQEGDDEEARGCSARG